MVVLPAMVLPATLVGASTAWQLAIIIPVIAIVVAGGFFGLYTIMFPRRSAADRLADLGAEEVEGPQDSSITGTQTPWQEFATRLNEMIDVSADPEEVAKTKAVLKHAGYKDKRAFEVLNGVRIAGLFGGPVAASLLALFLTPQAALLSMVIAAGVGYYLPYRMVVSRAEARQAEIVEGLPDALDLLVSCVESGLGIDQAFRRVAGEMDQIAPQLAREFVMVNSEVSAGIDRITALQRLQERTGVDEIRSLVNMLAQAERYGTSIAEALKIFSEVAREKRMARAEEAAGAVGTKVTFVMIIFFLPVLGVVLVAPTMLNILLGES